MTSTARREYDRLLHNLDAQAAALAWAQAHGNEPVWRAQVRYDGARAEFEATFGQPVNEAAQVLGLQAGFTADDVKSAYRRLAKESHPDMPGGDAIRFRTIHAAYCALSA